MSWKKEMTVMVRVFINDLGPTYLYNDTRIQQAIVVAGQYVQFNVNLDTKYTVDILNPNFTPDPTLSTPKDEIFIFLTILKAACIVDQSTFRTKAALEGIRASLGAASLSVGNHLAGYKTILELGPCALYEDLTEHWDVANATAVRAIFSPFVGNNFDPQNINSGLGYSSERSDTGSFF